MEDCFVGFFMYMWIITESNWCEIVLIFYFDVEDSAQKLSNSYVTIIISFWIMTKTTLTSKSLLRTKKIKVRTLLNIINTISLYISL